MKRPTRTLPLTAALVSALMLASPFALADHHDRGTHHKHKMDRASLCEKLESGDWEDKRDQFREKAQKHHEEVAERLQLTDEQREIWDEIQAERHEKHKQRLEAMKERCQNQQKQ